MDQTIVRHVGRGWLVCLSLFAAACDQTQGTGGNGPPDLTMALPGDAAMANDGGAVDLAMLRTRPFPDTSKRIAVLADQLPGLSVPQRMFVVSHFVGTQKLTLDLSKPLRALSPDFLVLHYHLAIWQSAPGVDFIVDGKTWGNDYPTVDMHEPWFWHNANGQRVASNVDKKLLMNIADPGFQQYWADSLVAQTVAGDYDGIFFDSASPALLNFEAQSPSEPRFAGTGVKDNVLPELGNKTYIHAWEDWMAALDARLAGRGIPLIPNTSAFVTTWDNTNYGLTAGAFVEGFASPSFSLADWKASTTTLLGLTAKNKIVILQNYLKATTDLANRRYYLANYLLVKGSRTYLDYFSGGPLEWYPEWTIDLGAATQTGAKADDLFKNGVYQRSYEKGLVLVNPSGSPVTVMLPGPMKRVEPQGGGAIPMDGSTPGTIGASLVTSIIVPAAGAEIFLQ